MSEQQAGDVSSMEKDKVVKIINSVIQKVNETEVVSKEAVFQELQELQRIINEVKRDVGAARPNDIADKHIPIATDELDAVIDATAEATGSIMDACEAIEEIGGKCDPENTTAISNEVIKIYEACSFQDITGQRISKVVSTLKEIDEKVAALLKIMSQNIPGDHNEDADGKAESADGNSEANASSDKDLLNGPQLPQNAISQEDIDRMLAELD